MSPLLIRTIGLLIPLLVTVVLVGRRKLSQPEWAGLLLASVWNLPALLLVQLCANRFHWWQFQAQGGVLVGLPIDLLIGWCLLWGAIPALTTSSLRLWVVILLFGWLDLILMPRCAPLLLLNQNWWQGELLALLIALLPAQLLARWTSEARQLRARVWLQISCFTAIVIIILPTIVLIETGGSWQRFNERPFWLNSLLLQLLSLPALIGLSAVLEFVERGGGTPLPYDPPRRLVSSGIYAYLANPVQSSIVLVLFGLAFLLKSGWLIVGALVAFAYGLGLAGWDEEQDLNQRFGEQWQCYRGAVRRWWPRWRPWHRSIIDGPSARLYYDQDCPACSVLARWFTDHRSIGLALMPAQQHPSCDLRRLTYDPLDGSAPASGIYALARALEHLNFAWAIVAIVMRLPLLGRFLQLLSDAVGGGPRLVCRREQLISQPAIELSLGESGQKNLNN